MLTVWSKQVGMTMKNININIGKLDIQIEGAISWYKKKMTRRQRKSKTKHRPRNCTHFLLNYCQLSKSPQNMQHDISFEAFKVWISHPNPNQNHKKYSRSPFLLTCHTIWLVYSILKWIYRNGISVFMFRKHMLRNVVN